MTINRTTLLDFPLPVTGTESGTWGDTTNNGLTQYLDIAIAGALSITGSVTLATTEGDASGTGIVSTTAQYRTLIVPASGPSANIVITAPSSNRTYHVINRNATYTVQIRAGVNSGVTLSAGQSATVAYDSVAGDYVLVGSASGAATLSGNNAFTGANTFYNATGQTFAPASTNDGIIILGRAGGSSSYRVTFATTTLSASRTLTLPDATDTVAVVGTAQTFTAAQTFRAANAIRSEAASTQDAIVLAGRAGGSSSYAITLTPATLSASRTVTFPDGGGNYTVGYRNVPAVGTQTGSYTLATADVGKYVQVGSGGSITIPDATFAEGDIISLFNNTSGNITITCTITTAYIAGTDSDKATMTLATRGVATILFISSTVCVVSGNVT